MEGLNGVGSKRTQTQDALRQRLSLRLTQIIRSTLRSFLFSTPLAPLSMLALFTTLTLALGDPTPPCPAPFPDSAVSETWCSVPLATNPSTGVTVAQYGLPAGSTLVTAATTPSVWYEENFYLGGGIYRVFEYLATARVIQNGRTVPFIIRPQSPLATPAGWWLTSMLVSPANYPNAATTLPVPNATTNPGVTLEPLGTHIFATLDFNSTYCPPLYPPPYFTDFQRCDALLAAGLPSGWVIKGDSVWTPSWLLYNKANYNGTWTSRCLAEVVKGSPATLPATLPAVPVPVPAPASLPPPPPSSAAPAAAVVVAPPPPFSATRVLRGALTPGGGEDPAPPICAIMLEFETFYWGAWAPPHAPNTALDIDGGSDGLTAQDDAGGVVVFPTSTDTPFFALRLVALTLSTGKVTTVGDTWPLPPTGFSGVHCNFEAVEHSVALGFVVLCTEISQFGPMPTRSSIPGTPLGWTVAVALDPSFSGKTTALTADLSPSLQAYPPLVGGLSALDSARSMLWLLSAADGANPTGPQGCPQHPAVAKARRGARRGRNSNSNSSSTSATAAAAAAAALFTSPPRAANTLAAPSSTEAFFLGVPLAQAPPHGGAPSSSPPATAATPTGIPIVGEGMIVTAFEYSSAVEAIVALSYNATGSTPPSWKYTNSLVTLYPVNGSTPLVIGGIPANTYTPLLSIGASQVSADGRYVYFGTVQPSNTFESAALIIVDTLARTIQTSNAAPTDDYDVMTLFRCP